MEDPGTRGGFPGAFPFLDAAHLIPPPPANRRNVGLWGLRCLGFTANYRVDAEPAALPVDTVKSHGSVFSDETVKVML